MPAAEPFGRHGSDVIAITFQQKGHRLQDPPLGSVGRGQDYQDIALRKVIGHGLLFLLKGQQAGRDQGHVVRSGARAAHGLRELGKGMGVHRLVASITLRAFCRPMWT